MHRPSRPLNASDGSKEVTTTEYSGGDPPPVVGVSAQTPSSNYGGERSFSQPGAGGGEPGSPSWYRNPTSLVWGRPTFHFPLFRRSSSGYFSSDSESSPSSPLFTKPVTADKATQTPSPASQVMNHALQRMADEAHGGGPGTHRQHGLSPNPSSTQQNTAGVMQAEAFGRQLRAIGDDYNRLLMQRRLADRRRWDVIPLNLLPHIHQEPVAVFCVGLLLLLMGRFIYLQGSTNSRDHSQV
ncbi:uncharacterized protein LOC121655339 isoform X2 [Melanotaenia boesemani]|uniref:uncharacterized protein LOC121655339 isoform X2 n=1 Tax=Melanotaenia boesemani TaxID=1250792 RepID=UPI001C045ED7|nr:uncharacterized protein LOC121655339 isoform X2 [Melanotaenia boesemani]